MSVFLLLLSLFTTVQKIIDIILFIDHSSTMSAKSIKFELIPFTPCPVKDPITFKRFIAGHPIKIPHPSKDETFYVINPLVDQTKIKYVCGMCCTPCSSIPALNSHIQRCSAFLLQKFNKEHINKCFTESLSPPPKSCKTTLIPQNIVTEATKSTDGYNVLTDYLWDQLTPEQRETKRLNDKNKLLEDQVKQLQQQVLDNQANNVPPNPFEADSKQPSTSQSLNPVNAKPEPLLSEGGSDTESDKEETSKPSHNKKRKTCPTVDTSEAALEADRNYNNRVAKRAAKEATALVVAETRPRSIRIRKAPEKL